MHHKYRPCRFPDRFEETYEVAEERTKDDGRESDEKEKKKKKKKKKNKAGRGWNNRTSASGLDEDCFDVSCSAIESCVHFGSYVS